MTDRASWPYTLIEMRELAAHVLRSAGVQNYDILSDGVVSAFARKFGGRDWYIPKVDKIELALRDARVWAEFTGRNHDELAARYNMSRRQIERIIDEQRDAARK